jgi:uncharacterized protein (TIGR02391 family)
MTPKRSDPPPIEPREFRSPEEIDIAIGKLHRRIEQLESVDIPTSVARNNAAVSVCRSNIRDTIREVFGPNSPEFKEHGHVEIWVGAFQRGMSVPAIISTTQRGRVRVVGILKGLVARLEERKSDLTTGRTLHTSMSFDRVDLHLRLRDVSRDLFVDGHSWDAVFAASKALVNYVKERSGRHDLDGAQLMRTVFSAKDPTLAFNDLADQTDRDEQEGMMHLFEGAVLAIRNPGSHAFPEGSEQRALEYICFLSLLAYRVQEATKLK